MVVGIFACDTSTASEPSQGDFPDTGLGPLDVEVGVVLDQGPMDAEAGPPDALDAGLAGDVLDAEPEDEGLVDLGPPDLGPPDMGPEDLGLQIATSSITPTDPCVARSQQLRANRGGELEWILITDPAALLQLSGSPAGPTPARLSSEGLLDLAPVFQRIPGLGVVGVQLTDPQTGEQVEAGWELTQEGLANYIVSLGGGPIVFNSPMIPPVSRTSTVAYRARVASPVATHPCSGVTYRTAPGCLGGIPAEQTFDLLPSGELAADPADLVPLAPGPHCVRIEAVIDDPPVVLHGINLLFSVVL